MAHKSTKDPPIGTSRSISFDNINEDDQEDLLETYHEFLREHIQLEKSRHKAFESLKAKDRVEQVEICS